MPVSDEFEVEIVEEPRTGSVAAREGATRPPTWTRESATRPPTW
ncbi:MULTISPECIES: hypothetical protein [Streptomyces]|nr:hypothetical protein [Streptomyces sp. RM72]